MRPEWARSRMYEAFLDLLRRLAADGPVVLAIEDLHWADDSTRELLAFLVRNAQAERLLLLVTFRSDELAPPPAAVLARRDRPATRRRADRAATARPRRRCPPAQLDPGAFGWAWPDRVGLRAVRGQPVLRRGAHRRGRRGARTAADAPRGAPGSPRPLQADASAARGGGGGRTQGRPRSARPALRDARARAVRRARGGRGGPAPRRRRDRRHRALRVPARADGRGCGRGRPAEPAAAAARDDCRASRRRRRRRGGTAGRRPPATWRRSRTTGSRPANCRALDSSVRAGEAAASSGRSSRRCRTSVPLARGTSCRRRGDRPSSTGSSSSGEPRRQASFPASSCRRWRSCVRRSRCSRRAATDPRGVFHERLGRAVDVGQARRRTRGVPPSR